MNRPIIFMPFSTAVILWAILSGARCTACSRHEPRVERPIGATSRFDPAELRAYTWMGAGGVESIALLGRWPDGGQPWEWFPTTVRLDSREVGWPVICAREGHVVRVLVDQGDGGLTIGCAPAKGGTL